MAAKEMTYREVGTVIQTSRGSFRRIKWEDGDTEGCNLPELVLLGKGQRFEAMVTRRAGRPYTILRISDVLPLEPLKRLTPEESLKLWNSIQTAAMAPEVSWDDLK